MWFYSGYLDIHTDYTHTHTSYTYINKHNITSLTYGIHAVMWM